METIKLSQLLRRAESELGKAKFGGDVVRDALKQVESALDDIKTVRTSLQTLRRSL